MAEQARPTLGYWASRSICGSIRCLLAHLGIDYENKIYPVGPPPDFDKTEWFSEKFELGLTYPNLPYWIDEDVKITEGKAILKFICMKYAPQYLGGTVQENASADMLFELMYDFFYDEVCCPQYPEDYDEDLCNAKVREHFTKFQNNRKGRQFAVTNDSPTYVDFFAYEFLLRVYDMDRTIIDDLSLQNYVDTIEALPGVVAYREENKDRNWNNVYAFWKAPKYIYP